MDDAEIFQRTARLRRQFPRVEDVNALCDEIERLVRDSAAFRSRPVFLDDPAARAVAAGKPKRDRAAYMREYRARKA